SLDLLHGNDKDVANKCVTSRRWLPVVIGDPRRYSYQRPDTMDKSKSFLVMGRVKEYLAKMGFSEPVECDSGLGYQLIYSVDLPNDASATALVGGVLSRLRSDL